MPLDWALCLEVPQAVWGFWFRDAPSLAGAEYPCRTTRYYSARTAREVDQITYSYTAYRLTEWPLLHLLHIGTIHTGGNMLAAFYFREEGLPPLLSRSILRKPFLTVLMSPCVAPSDGSMVGRGARRASGSVAARERIGSPSASSGSDCDSTAPAAPAAPDTPVAPARAGVEV